MKHLIQIVQNYLSTPNTDYAILIKGTWGCGKTYFLKNSIFKEIKEKEYDPIYISLYGVSSKEDIYKKIFLTVNPNIGSKTGQKLSELVKAGLNAIQIDTGKFKPKTWLKIKKNKILCFDDLERVNMDLHEILGFINNLVEHDNLKVIIIANEDKIVEYEKDAKDKNSSNLKNSIMSYDLIKEKLIGRTIKYKPDIEDVLTNIIESYSNDNEFAELLGQNRRLIIDIFKKSESENIRILKHAIASFHTIFLEISKRNPGYIEKHTVQILIYVLAFTFEVEGGGKDRNKNKEKLQKIKDHLSFYLFLRVPDQGKKYDQYLQSYYDKYYEGSPDELFFNNIISNYIINGIFDIDAFNLQIKQDKEKEEKGAKLEPIRKIWGGVFYKLSNKEFDETIDQLFSMIDDGEIPLHLYPDTFVWLNYFLSKDLLDMKIEALYKKIKEGIQESFKKTAYEDVKHYSMKEILTEGETESAKLKEIRKAVKENINSCRDKYKKDKITKLFNFLPDNFPEFQEYYFDDEELLHFTPIFKYVDSTVLYNKIINLKNNDIRELSIIVRNRYKSCNSDFKNDYKNLKSLYDQLGKYLMANPKKLSILLLQSLNDEIKKAYISLEQYLS